MKEGVGITVVILIAVLGLTWLVQGNDFFMYKVFAPKYEQVRHDTFKQSQAYNDGAVNQLQAYWLEYQKATPEHKQALASVIVRESANVDENRMPSDLRAFVFGLRNNATAPKSDFK